MMGRLNHEQEQLFTSSSSMKVVPDDHLAREIAAVLDLPGLTTANSRPTIRRSGARRLTRC